MRKKLFIILIVVFLPSLFYISEPINASVSLDDFAYDNYVVYDQSGKYPLANLTFIAQLIYDNESHIFYLDQKVSLEIISTPLTEHWGLKSFNFTTEKEFGFWSINSTHMQGTIRIPYAQEGEYEVNLNSEIETRQEIIPPAYWSNESFTLSPSFRNLFFSLKDGTICKLNRYVYFTFNNFKITSESVVNGEWILDYDINPWIIIKEEFLYIIIFTCLVLWILIIIQGYKLRSNVKSIIDKKITSINVKNYRFHNINDGIHSFGWISILFTSFIYIMISINELRLFNFGVTFFILNFSYLLIIFISTFIIREMQDKVNKEDYEKGVKSDKLEDYSKLLKLHETIKVKYPPIRDMIILIFSILLTPILEKFLILIK